MRNSVGLWLFRGAPRLTVMTMVLPTRRTLSMVAPVRVSEISVSGDLKVCGLPLVQTLAMRWPWTRAWTPLAMVSTSGSSGIGGVDQKRVAGDWVISVLCAVYEDNGRSGGCGGGDGFRCGSGDGSGWHVTGGEPGRSHAERDRRPRR